MHRLALASALASALALAALPAAAHPYARSRADLALEQGPAGQLAPAAADGPLAPWSPPTPAAPPAVSGAATPDAQGPVSSDLSPTSSPTVAPAPAPHPLQIWPAVDLPVIALGLALHFGADFADRGLRWAGCSACDRSALGGLDRRVLGNEDLTAAHVSDALLFTAIGAPFLADLADALASGRRAPGGPRHAAAGWGKDAVVLLEVLAVNLGLTDLVKFAVRRPRPYSYEASSPLGDVHDNEARLSFYSGHASTTFAMATAYATLFTLRHPRARAAVPMWIAALGLGTATSVLRVVAGKHFWTDVLTGALAGAAVGVLVPVLHRTRPDRRLAAGLRPGPTGATFSLSGAF